MRNYVRAVAKASLWLLSWTRASYTLMVDRPALEAEPTDPLVAYCHRVQCEILPLSFAMDHYVLHDSDVEEKWEPSETQH